MRIKTVKIMMVLLVLLSVLVLAAGCSYIQNIKSLYSSQADEEVVIAEEYENNFNPHITIARDLDSKTLSKAIFEMKDDFACEGIIEEIVLVVVNKKSVKESLDPKNLTIYHL